MRRGFVDHWNVSNSTYQHEKRRAKDVPNLRKIILEMYRFTDKDKNPSNCAIRYTGEVLYNKESEFKSEGFKRRMLMEMLNDRHMIMCTERDEAHYP